MSKETQYKTGDFVSNKRIHGSVYVVHHTNVSGVNHGGGGTGYIIRSLHHHKALIAVDDHILNYYYTRVNEEDVPIILLDALNALEE